VNVLTFLRGGVLKKGGLKRAGRHTFGYFDRSLDWVGEAFAGGF